jgi:transcription elongation factor Elf1
MLQHYKRLKVCKQDVIKCPERNCQYTCNNKTDLKGHINSRHIHYRVIECEVCGEWFYTQKAAHSHKKNRHPDFSFSQGNHRASRNHQAAEEEEDSEDDSDDSQTDDDLDISTGNYSKQSAAGLDPANAGVQASNGKQAKGSNTIKIESPKSSHRSHPTVQRRRSTRSQKNVTITINTNSSDSNTPSPHSNPIQPSASSQPQIIQLSSLMQPHNVQIHAMQTQEQGIITSLPLHQTPHHIIHIRPTPDAAFVAHFRPVTGQSFPNYQHHPYLQSMQTPYGTFSAAACVYRPNIQLTNTQALNGGNSGGGGIINESIEYPADSLSFMDEGLDLDQELDFPQPSIYHTNPYNGLPTTVKINTNDVTLTSPTNAATSAPMTQVSMTTASVSASPLVSSSSVAASHNNSIQNQWIWSR